MSVNKTVTLEAKTKGFDEAEKQIEDVSKATKVANDSVEGLNKTFEEANGKIQPLTARMGEAEDRLYELALAGDTTSKEYQGLLNKVGEYRKVQIQTDIAVDGAATTLSEKLGGALTGATSGFAAVQGVMALTGGESEELEKSLLKVQGAMAIQQGVQGLIVSYRQLGGATGLATKAQAALNFVMALNPFILIAAGVTAAIAALVKFTSFLDPAIDKLKQFSDFIGLTDFAEEKRATARQKRFEAEKQRAKDRQKLLKDELQDINLLIQGINRLNNRRNEGLEKRIRLLQAAGKETRQIERQILKNNIENEAKILKEQAKKVDATKKNGSEMLAFEKLRYAGQLKLVKDAEFELKVFDTESARIRRENATKEVEEEKIEFDGKIERLQIQAATEVDIDKEKNEQIAKNAEEARERQKAAAQSLLDTEKAIEDARMANIESGISLFKDLAGENNKLQAMAIAAESAVSIAKTIIATQAANAAATAQGTALAITTAGASVAAAAALVTQNNISAGISIAAQIAAAAKGISALGGGASPASGGNLGGDGGSGGQAPSFNIVGNSSINQLAQLQQAPVQAFVVSGEVTTSQALDRNRVENATL